MNTVRTIRSVFIGRPTMEGAGVRLHRVFGYDQVPSFDPFLMLDDFGSEDPDEYMAGKPIGEPVAWRGPIVMNSEAELEQAFREYHNGTFIKPR